MGWLAREMAEDDGGGDWTVKGAYGGETSGLPQSCENPVFFIPSVVRVISV